MVWVPTLACGTGADGVTELVVSFDGKPATRLSGPELDVQPPSRRQPKRNAGTADERMRTRTQNNRGHSDAARRPRNTIANGRLSKKTESYLYAGTCQCACQFWQAKSIEVSRNGSVQAVIVVRSTVLAPGEFFLIDSMAWMADAFALYPSDENIVSPLDALKRKRYSPALS